MGTLLIIRWRGQTDGLRICGFPQIAANDDIVDVTCRSVEKSARLTSLANRTGNLACRLVETLTRSTSVDDNVDCAER